MSERRWRAGDRFWCDEVEYRVMPGRKGPDDLRLEHYVNGEWRPVKMETGFLLADFFFENEHVLYPRAKGYRGGYEYLRAIQHATRYGWESTQQQLREQQARIREALQGCLPTRYRHDGDAL